MSRLSAISPASRPKMFGRAMLSGPSGAGKTWTALSFARTLVGDGTLLVIDTERESALTYADVFGFEHLPWRPPFDPTELGSTLAELGDTYDCVVIDSLSHFWRSVGGVLDIADGRIGGWKTARPVQEQMVQQILAMPCHVIVTVRSKMEYLVENGGKSVTKVGMAPIQDDGLVYEMNVALDIDLDHRLTVTKSRTPAVPVGRMYPAGHESQAAQDYVDWLAGGVPPANREDVSRIVTLLAEIADAEVRKRVKGEFVARFGMPHSLTAEQAPDALAFVMASLAQLDQTAGGGGTAPGEEAATPAPDTGAS